MAIEDQEKGLPVNGNESVRETANHLPKYFRTNFNKKFLNATLDQLTAPGQVERLNVFYGRTTAKAYSSTDNYVGDVTKNRENYQLEPVTVIKDNVGNVNFYSDYNDYINTIDILAGNSADHSKLNEQEFYSWHPHVDWDKFINFRNYYWLPSGPQPVTIIGRTKDITTTFTIELREEDENILYQWTPDGLTGNRTITLYRGQTYKFEINTPSYAMAIATKVSFIPGTETEQNNASLLYTDDMKFFDEDGVELDDVAFIEKGHIEWTVPQTAPDTLYYISKDNVNTAGMIKIYDIINATEINVDEEIIGKKIYESENGVSLSNGMKINFAGTVLSEKYATGNWYVEGVGTEINLVSESSLSLNSSFVEDISVPFGDVKFDSYPFAEALGYPTSKDYLTINRASLDSNLWSKHNYWFHIDVIEKSFKYNNASTQIDYSARAIRPIIEFEKNLKLFNHGTYAKATIDLLDTSTKDVFSTVEGSIGYYIDGVEIVAGMRVMFLADKDLSVYGKVYEVDFIVHNNRTQVTLKEASDALPLINETVHIKFGEENGGKIYHYTGENWVKSQLKTDVNQPPLFDLFDTNDISFNDNIYYAASQFGGNKIFSYKEGTGTVDSELGFSLSYQNINNTGDILFNFDLVNQEFFYAQTANEFTKQKTDTAFLRRYSDRENYENVNGYHLVEHNTTQNIIRQYIGDGTTNEFLLDMYVDNSFVDDLWIRVYKNNDIQQKDIDFIITTDSIGRHYIQFISYNIEKDDNIIVKTRSSVPKSAEGFYEIPYNLERNPLNTDIVEFTLGEVTDHVFTIIEEMQNFVGIFPGSSNLRDAGDVSRYGRRFLKHSGPINLSMYHLQNEHANIIDALNYARIEYAKFKRAFVDIASNLGYHGEPKQHVDAILTEFIKDKTNNMPYYFSDMVPIGGRIINTIDIYDSDEEYFGIGDSFSMDEVSLRAIQVYRNGAQYIYGKDYTFNDEGYVRVTGPKNSRDIIEVYSYDNTGGCYVPPTPTKLGLYPKYEPKIYIDDTAITQIDFTNTGPYTLYGIPTKDSPASGQLGWFYPLYIDRDVALQKEQELSGTNDIFTLRFEGLNRVFYMPAALQNLAVEYSTAYDEWPENNSVIQGHDGSLIAAFKDYRDLLILDLEKRIYNNIKVNYDPKLFPLKTMVDSLYRKNGISRVDLNSSIISDYLAWKKLINIEHSNHPYLDVDNTFTFNYKATFFNGEATPGWWREIYKYAFDTDRPHTHPWEMLGFSVEPKWWREQYGEAPYTSNNLMMWTDIENGVIREPKFAINNDYKRPGLLNRLPVDEYGNLISPNDSVTAIGTNRLKIGSPFTFGDGSPVETAWRRSSEYPFSLLKAAIVNRPSKTFATAFDRTRQIRNKSNQIVYKDTNRQIELHKLSFPIESVDDEVRTLTSGLINYITDYRSVLVQDRYAEYKEDLATLTNQLAFKIGGFTDKTKFNLLLESRSPLNESNIYVPVENYDIILSSSYPITEYVYSGVIIEKTDGGFYIRGYDLKYPIFSYYKPVVKQSDPVINVGGYSESYVTWAPRKTYVRGAIVYSNDQFFRCKTTHLSQEEFNLDNFAKLPRLPTIGGVDAYFYNNYSSQINHIHYDTLFKTVQEVVDFLIGYGEYLKSLGFQFNKFLDDDYTISDWKFAAKQFMFWVSQNWDMGALLTVSPAAHGIEFSLPYATVGNVYDTSVGYSVLRADGTPLKSKFLRTTRDNQNNFSIQTVNTPNGIYGIRIPVVLKEHIALIDNKTVFNDIIYDPPAGYRQERIKVVGYRVANWNGSLNIPGFVYDSAIIHEWKEWQDYDVGDIVKHKEFYYTANEKVPGSSIFVNDFWKRMDGKPEAQLYSNFDYKTEQFRDFYDLDSENFDSEQQRMAQHLIGYQKREYLRNIINNEVSQYKFYQGFIQEKGTRNSLTKLFDVLSAADKESLEFYEEWAIKNSQYGASTGFDEIDFIIKEDEVLLQPQPVLLTNESSRDKTDLIMRIKEDDIYLKPSNDPLNPFPQKIIQGKTYTKNAGYVHPEDVDFTIGKYDELLSLDIASMPLYSHVWVGNNQKKDWDVVTYEPSEYNLVALSGSSGFLIIETDNIPTNILVGEIVGISNIKKTTYESYKDSAIQQLTEIIPYTGFFKVVNKKLNQVYCELNGAGFEAIEDVIGNITIFKSSRMKDTDELSARLEKGYPVGRRLWLDETGENKWNVLQKNNDVANNSVVLNPSEDMTNTEFGTAISVNTKSNTMIIGAPNEGFGKVYVYTRSNQNSEWFLNEILEANENLTDTPQRYGESVEISSDGHHIIVGAPNASNVKSNSLGAFDKTLSYEGGDVVEYDGSFWQAKGDIFVGDQSFTFSTFYNINEKLVELNLDDEEDPTIKFILTGNYPTTNKLQDHWLLRLPKNIYDGTIPGMQIQLRWNTLTSANQTQISFEERQPFDGTIDYFVDNINGWHTVVDKVDAILNIPNLISSPQLLEFVSSTTGTGKITHMIIEGDNAILYINELVGYFDSTGTLSIGNLVIGDYVKMAPDDTNTNINNEFGGYIKIDLPTGQRYAVYGKNYESSRGVVITDIRTDDSYVSGNYYYNILDYKPTVEYGLNTSYSQLHNFSRQGTRLINQGLYTDQQTFLPYIGIRGPKDLTDTLAIGDEFKFYFNTLKRTVSILKVRNTRYTFAPPVVVGETLTQENTGATAIVYSATVDIAEESLDPSNPVYNVYVQHISDFADFNRLDKISGSESGDLFIRPVYEPVTNVLVTPESIGIQTHVLNTGDDNHTVAHLWDGYIDYVEEYYSSEGLPYIPVGKYVATAFGEFALSGNDAQTIRQLDNGATADVMYVQRLSNTLMRVYVDNVQGNWTVGSEYGEDKEFEMLALPGQTDAYNRKNIYDISRTIGTVRKTSVGYSSENIGKMIVIKTIQNTDIIINEDTNEQIEEIVGEEYWLYSDETVSGTFNVETTPNPLSTVWQQIYQVVASPAGSASSFVNEGLVYIYKKFGSHYVQEKVVLSPQRGDNMYFGSIVKIRKSDSEMYKGYVLARASTDTINPGKIYFLKNGYDGIDYYYWDYGRYQQYRGQHNETKTYIKDDIVYLDTKLYRAKTNLLPSPFVEVYWEEIDTMIDYVGYIPNDLSYTALLESDGSSRLDLQQLYDFGSAYDVSEDGEVIAVYTKNDYEPNVVSIYRNYGEQYMFSQNLIAPTTESGFGESVGISPNGEFVFVAAPYDDSDNWDQGRVYIYKLVNTSFELHQTIVCPKEAALQKFGITVAVDETNLAIGCINGDVTVRTTLDGEQTTLDNNSTQLSYINQDTGVVYLYEKIGHNYVFGQELYYEHYNPVYGFGEHLSLKNNNIFVGLPKLRMSPVVSSYTINRFIECKDFITYEINGTLKELNPSLVYDEEAYVDLISSFIDFIKTTLLFGRSSATTSRYKTGLQDIDHIVGYSDRLNAAQSFKDIAPVLTLILQGTEIDSSEYNYIPQPLGVYEINYTESLAIQSFFNDFADFVTNGNLLATPNYTYPTITMGSVISFNKPRKIYEVLREVKETVDLERIKQVVLYDKAKQQVIDYIDYIDPLQGKIPGNADANIRYKLYYDPALYNYSTNTSLNTVEVTNWGEEQVGQLWWDLSTARYYYPYQADVRFSSNYWSKTFPGNSIDIYEWVESEMLPSEWDALDGSTQGNAIGVSGKSLYGDNTYVQGSKFDGVAQRFTPVYYYWVKNKTDIPTVDGRTMSALSVANIIQDPSKNGHKFITFINSNSFSIHNCYSYFKSEDVVLSVQYYNIENKDIPIYDEYQILTENYPTSVPKRDIEAKWVDSLVGYDEFGRAVPDPAISEKYRYGTLSTPRQGWFKNRIEAVKQWCERINYVLRQNMIVDTKNLSLLYTKDEYPAENLRLYDLAVDSYQELVAYGTSRLESATAEITVVDGVIRTIKMLTPGRGFLVEPSYIIHGKGEGAEIKFTLNSVGSIASAEIVNGGRNYNSATTIEIRQFTALVRADEGLQGKWAMYQRNLRSNEWDLIRVQGFNVTVYWDFIDWYANGYTSYTLVDHFVDYPYLIDTLKDEIGDIVKIASAGAGGWLLLEKINDIPNADYTINYKTIGRENGTLQFSEKLYDLTAGLADFDYTNFDISFYDSMPSQEIRVIAKAVKEDLFIDDLAHEYNKLFFASIRYVLHEHKYVDWLFKTAFLRVQHNVGTLREDVTFSNDNLSSYQEYINEAKAFKAKVREYISAYEKIDNTYTRTTDFDLAPYYDIDTREIVPYTVKAYPDGLVGDETITTYPAKNWLDNCRYKIVNVHILDPGFGYTSPPVITVSGGGGENTILKSYLGVEGKLRYVQVVDQGTGYLSSPSIHINGSFIEGGHPAVVAIELGDALPRRLKTDLRFDRISGKFDVTDLVVEQTIVAAGTKFVLDLEWPMDLQIGKTTVQVNGLDVLSSEISYKNVLDTSKSYTRYYGQITLEQAPPIYSSVYIKYTKNINLLSAADRINFYYEPTVGQYGKDLSQLMDGIDYSGVEVRSFDFGRQVGWDTSSWYTKNYDSYDMSYEDIVYIVPPMLQEYSVLGYRTKLNLLQVAKAISAIANSELTQVAPNFVQYFTVNQLDQPLATTTDPTSILNIADDAIGVTMQSAHVLQKYVLGELTETAYINNIEQQILPKFSQLSKTQLDNLIIEGIIEELYVVTETPLENGQVYNVYYNDLRIDDPNYGDASLQTNPNAIITSIIGDGVATQVKVTDLGIIPETDDIIILRKPSSDGSYIPSDIDFDTIMTGGDIEYANAKGINAEDIIIDGDNFVTPTTSKGPEEVVPGQVVDAVDIQVFEKPAAGGVSNITCRNFTTDGKTKSYPIGVQPLTGGQVIVKLDDKIKKLGKDYTIDGQEQTVIFAATPRSKRKLNIIHYDYSGDNLREYSTKVGDGLTTLFLVNTKWSDHLSAMVSVDAKEVGYGLIPAFGLGLGAGTNGLTAIQFAVPPDVGSIIKYVVFEGSPKPYSEIIIDTFIVDPSTISYELSTTPLQQEPLEWHTLVVADDKLLNPGYTETFVLTDATEYRLKLYQVPLLSVTSEQVRVFLNDVELENPKDFFFTTIGVNDETLDPDERYGSAISLNPDVHKSGDIMKVYITAYDTDDIESGGDYRYGYFDADTDEFVVTPNTLYINKELPVGSEIMVYQFTNHDTQKIDWQSFDVDMRTRLSRGYIASSQTIIITDPAQLVRLDIELEFEQLYSVTVNGIRIDDINYGTDEAVTNPNAQVPTYIGKGGNTFYLSEIGNFFRANDVLRLEKLNAEVISDAGSQDWYEFRQLQNGIIPLNSEAIEVHYVWVAVNGKLLTPSVDYYLTNDNMAIRLNTHLMPDDNVQTVHFAGNKVAGVWGFRMFKDILNRTHYTVLDSSSQVVTLEPLQWYDKTIKVTNGDRLPNPGLGASKPGVILINKERLEYYQVQNQGDGVWALMSLRRGTLGTGVPETTPTGTPIIDISTTKVIPYKDEFFTTEFIADGVTNTFTLDFVPSAERHHETKDTFEVYVAGRRLRKTPLDIFKSELAQDSPEGDITVEPEYSVDGNNIVLFEIPGKNQKIHVIRKQGKLWAAPGDTLAETNSNIARMILSTQVTPP